MNKNINKTSAIQKGLIVEDNYHLYMELENIYKYIFEYYLCSTIDLKNYNDKIKNSNLDFGIPHPTKKQLFNNLNEYLNLEYIYLLNNFFIEKLDIDDITLLKQHIGKSNLTVNNTLLDLIKRTYKEVVKDNFFNDEYTDKIYKVCYGDMHPGNFTDNNAIVLKIYYSKNTTTMSDEEFLENMKKKKIFLQKLSDQIKKDVKNKLDINCDILIEKIPN